MKRFKPTECSKQVQRALLMTSHDCKMTAALALSGQDRMAFFYFSRIKHPNLKLAMDQLDSQMQEYAVEDITLLIGPTGIGKTTMTNHFYELKLEKCRREMRKDSSIIPIIRLEAPATGEIQFSHRVFYTQMLNQLRAPIFKTSHDPKKLQAVMESEKLGKLVAGLRLDVEVALAARQCDIAIIDEAYHLVGGAGTRLAAQINGLKSLSNLTSTKFVLAGSYDLLPILKISGQLTRRSAVLHAGRYQRGVEKDRSAFGEMVSKLSRLMPLEEQPDLLPFTDLLMRACVGVPGILKETLQRALGYALAGKGWNNSCLERALLTKAAHKEILAECMKGEKDIRQWVSGTATFSDYEGPDEEAALAASEEGLA